MSFGELFKTCSYYSVVTTPSDISTYFVRFVCMTILHLSLLEEVGSFLKAMKYVCNHSYRFESPWAAFSAAFGQVLTSILIETANDVVLIMTSDTLSIIGNFVSLVIIAEFDNFVFDSMKGESFRVLVDKEFTEKVFVISHTTSKKCREDEKSDQVDENGELRSLRVAWKSRRGGNKCMYSIYKYFRVFYVSIYFYFFPFFFIIINTIIPLIFRGNPVVCPAH